LALATICALSILGFGAQIAAAQSNCPAGALQSVEILTPPATPYLGTAHFYGYLLNFPASGQSTWLYCVESTGDNEISHTIVETVGCWGEIPADGAGKWSGDPAAPTLIPGGVTIGTDGSTGITGIKWDEQVDVGTGAQYYFTINGKWAPLSIPLTFKGGPAPGQATGYIAGPDPECVNPLPIEMSFFEGSADGNRITLSWETVSETRNAGFAIEQATISSDFEQVGFVDGAGTSLEPRSYSYTLDNLAPDAYRFRLRQIDFEGMVSYSQTIEVLVEMPGRYFVTEAYPNPFNPQTSILLSVSKTQHVKAVVHDALGRALFNVLDTEVKANSPHNIRIDASGLPTGVYVVRFAGEDFAITRQIILAK
jgi:hypothetical protein